jgi:predicted P-loop ATPase
MLYAKALQMSVAGYSVIPLRKDKKPLIAGWKEFQTKAADQDLLTEWWEKYPQANIGIITGKISGITVVDIDVKGDTVVPLETFPETYTVKTPSGGYHLYYEYDPTIKQTANTFKKYPNVDIRNDGGYVVGPWSDNGKGGEYVVVTKKIPQKFPSSLFVEEQKSKSTGDAVDKIKKVRQLKEGEGRNHAMASLLGTLLKGKLISEFPEVKTGFLAIAEGMENPLPKYELEKIWESIAGRASKSVTEIRFMVDGKGFPITNLENIRKILLEDSQFAARCVFDTFLQKYLYRSESGQYRELNDSDEITLTREISIKYRGFEKVNPTMLRMVLLEVARENSVDAARDWIESIKWDGVKRLDSWLSKTYNVADNEYHRAVGSNWLKGLAKRIIEPGCKFDYVLVLEGKQGTKKSTSMGILGGEWYVETTDTPENKDFFMLLQGNLIIEFSEGETLSRGEIKKLKAVITTQYDKFRAPYERHIQTHPRRCVFAMTTNQEEYLKDETGNRRWLPVATIGEVNVDWLKANRDQLLAEALYRVRKLKETTYDFPDSVFEEQEKRQVTNPNTDRVMEWYYNELRTDQRVQGITPHLVHREALGMLNGHKFSRMDSIEITNILTAMKLERRRVRVGEARPYRWFKPDDVVPSTLMTDEELDKAF